MDLESFEKHRIDLKRPLLILRGSRGMLACGYINPATCSRTGEACAIVTGVSDFEAMISANVIAVSDLAQKMGIEAGMSGGEALKKFA